MNRTLLLVCLCLASSLRAEPPTEFETKKKGATTAAAAHSKAGRYAEAATVLTEFGKGAAKLRGFESYEADSLTRSSAEYEERAQWSARADKEPTAARQLLMNLLTPRKGAEAAVGSDPRIAELLGKLRMNDPKAKAFFAPRKVKVLPTGSVEGPLADELAIALVTPLRELGFEASTKDGAEVLTLETSYGKVIPMETGGLLGFKASDNMTSCELIVHARWMAGEAEVLKLDLSSRAGGYSDIPNSCTKAAILNVARKSVARVVETWNAQ